MNYSQFKTFRPFKKIIRGDEETIRPGTFIVYEWPTVEGGKARSFARVVSQVVRFADGTSPKRGERWLFVVAPNDKFTFGYERFIKADEIVEVSGDVLPFMRWFTTFRDFDPERIQAVIDYGGLSHNYIDPLLTAEGEIDPEWRDIANHTKTPRTREG